MRRDTRRMSCCNDGDSFAGRDPGVFTRQGRGIEAQRRLVQRPLNHDGMSRSVVVGALCRIASHHRLLGQEIHTPTFTVATFPQLLGTWMYSDGVRPKPSTVRWVLATSNTR